MCVLYIVPQSCPTLCDPTDCSTPGFPVLHRLLELAQTHVHRVSDAIQPSYPLLSPSPPAFNLAQHQGLFQWVSSLYQVVKVLELQLQYQSFQWIFRTDFLEDWLVWSLCSLRDSQESSPTPQFKSISSSALSFLYGPTLTSIHEHEVLVNVWSSKFMQSEGIHSQTMLIMGEIQRFQTSRSKTILPAGCSISWSEVTILTKPNTQSHYWHPSCFFI